MTINAQCNPTLKASLPITLVPKYTVFFSFVQMHYITTEHAFHTKPKNLLFPIQHYILSTLNVQAAKITQTSAFFNHTSISQNPTAATADRVFSLSWSWTVAFSAWLLAASFQSVPVSTSVDCQGLSCRQAGTQFAELLVLQTHILRHQHLV